MPENMDLNRINLEARTITEQIPRHSVEREPASGSCYPRKKRQLNRFRGAQRRHRTGSRAGGLKSGFSSGKAETGTRGRLWICSAYELTRTSQQGKQHTHLEPTFPIQSQPPIFPNCPHSPALGHPVHVLHFPKKSLTILQSLSVERS
jgi:hypothetical protein